ncbi:MAG: UDP-2,3-diacylglucosamine diphosphatase [gamma proteobacterium symbiont of Bathyaustriella thionipta]|nr:UDP-2,3-diacylglucosamine diphosphatase [gamma proteobacterium symbiont of Bathyaustriella thionipta]
MTSRIFISDLHLCDEQAQTLDFFLHFLARQASQVDELYILGDLFDSWIGDDNRAAPIPQVVKALQALGKQNTRLFLMHGNRDFLMGKAFCRATGAQLLQDPHCLQLQSCKILLMHGDLLCTDDVPYQQFRAQIRQPAFIQDFLSRPLQERAAIARQYRQKSMAAQPEKSGDIMDVNENAVRDVLQQYAADILIHGHTHRPAVHEDEQQRIRYVLSDWQPHAATILKQDSDGFKLLKIQPASGP